MTTTGDPVPLRKWARIARIGALVYLWATLTVAGFLLIQIVLSRFRPGADPDGYFLVFGSIITLVLVMAAAWFWLSAKAIATGSTVGVWAFTLGAIAACAVGALIGTPVVSVALLVLALVHVYVALRAQREW